ncbi:MAG: CopG family transcriptional regulator [Cyanobacteria bacterium J06634_5]
MSDNKFQDLPAYPISVGSAQSIRKTINLPADLVQELEEAAAAQGITFSEALRRAVEVNSHIRNILESGGNVVIQDNTGHYGRLEIQE